MRESCDPRHEVHYVFPLATPSPQTMRASNRRSARCRAASGIGKASALLFAQRGHRVIAVDRDAAGLRATLAKAASDCIAICPADILDPPALAAAVALAADRFGGLDVLVAAAAIGDCGRIDEMEPELWDLVIDVILKGSSHCCRAAIPAF